MATSLTTVRSLHVYPVKGARGIALERAEVLASGLRHDRRFMVVGEDGRFITQREHPRMALVDVAIAGDRLNLAAGKTAATVALEPERLSRSGLRRVRVWDDDVDAIDVVGEGAAFFSDYLGQRCSLVFMPLDVIRPVEPAHARPGDRVGFADAYPVLVASLASLAELNQRLVNRGAAPISIDRFRANIVIDGGEPYAEERASAARIGALTVRTPKRCARCQVITIDQQTGARGKEPLKTLASYRSEGNQVFFAMNAIPDLADETALAIAVGDRVTFAST